MADDNNAMDRLRDVEMRLFAEIGTQLKVLGENFRDFTDKMSTQMQDVRERLTRIESATGNESDRIDRLEAELHTLAARMESSGKDAAARLESAGKDTTVLDKRLLRLETIIVPVTALGATVASAAISAIAQRLFH